MPNYLAILVAALIEMIIGLFWFSPLLFLNQWMTLMNFKKEDSNKKAIFKMTGMFFSSIITSLILAVVIKITGNQTLTNGLGVGILMWFGFAMTAEFYNWIFANKKKELFFIETGYLLISYVLMGALLGAWK